MSTVLWANVLIAGRVKSEQADYEALYRHAEKLDALAAGLDLPSFGAICDTTDEQINLGVRHLPAGVGSSDELMALEGSWLPMEDALTLFTTLREHIVAANVRFGLLSNQQEQVVDELDAVLAFVRAETPHAEQFNFSVVS
ncbi:MAG: hypothetical protein R2826_10530 [Thermoleophilia bacterium]